MSLLTTTRKSVSEIASPDEFEALATAVLRAADPAYSSLVNVGTNADGRAVRSPVDGIGVRVHRGRQRLLLVQHTITARKALRRKWLDPDEGDVVKALAILADERKRGSIREAVLVLCSTVDPDQALIRDIHAAAGSEAAEAALCRARAAGLALSQLQAGELASALGHDPLLIGLNANWASPDPRDAIESYISSNIESVADDRMLASELGAALARLVERMVTARNISPTFGEIKTLLADAPDDLAGVRRLVDQGRVVRLGIDGRLAYRHDRVCDHLLANAITRLIETGRFTQELWTEPFFAELIGVAPTMLPPERIDDARARNPVALFAALQKSTLDLTRQRRLIAAAQTWIACPDFAKEAAESQRLHALRYLSRTDGAFVPALVRSFPRNFWTLEAQARNGVAGAAAALCRYSEPGMRDAWRDEIIAHALAHHPKFVDDVAALLQQPDLSSDDLEGVLNLAGEIGDARLCEALASQWRQVGAIALSTGWLWAALRCCPSVGHSLTDEVCRAWAALPKKLKRRGERDDNPRWDIAGHSLPWGLSRKSHPATHAYLLRLPKRHRGLTNILYSIVSHIDAPDAVLWSARASAAVDRRIAGKGSINFWRHDLERLWSPEQHGRALSAESRAALEKVWRNRRTNRFDRLAVFQIWSLTPTAAELADLRDLEGDPVLADHALRTRLAGKDGSAVPLLSSRLQSAENSSFWWQHARKVGLLGLEADIRRFFKKRRREAPKSGDWGDHTVAQLMMDARSEFAAATLIENWDQLNSSPNFVQAALYLATPETVALGQAAVKASADPRLTYV